MVLPPAVKALRKEVCRPRFNSLDNVCFGSLAAAARAKWDVRFTPNSCRGCQSLARPSKGDRLASLFQTVDCHERRPRQGRGSDQHQEWLYG